MFIDDVRLPPPPELPERGVVRNPTLDEIAAAFESMDGEFMRLLILSEEPSTEESYFPFGGRGMMIGGGGNVGLYCCTVGMEDNSTRHELCDPTANSEEDVEIMRGCLTPMESKYCVDRTTMLKALLPFVKDGYINEECSWETHEDN